MDRRLIPATPRIAHISLKGRVEVPVYTDGTPMRVAQPVADLLRSPHGPRERQLLQGEPFTVIDRNEGHAFGFAGKDGYCGWLADAALSRDPVPSHWVSTPGTHLYPEARIQAPEVCALSLGAQVAITANHGKWLETTQGFLPACHLRPLGDWLADPVAVAESLLGTPYLWGGNSRGGIDCSGLVQLAFWACGISLPGDSDLQESAGTEITPDAALRRGDLIFWKGHVALVVDETRLIHANGHTMSVAHEGIQACIDRIQAQEGRPVRHRRRVL
ncbi:C40 family peptidase [Tabrizicola oligotrophica]|uniref:C40 family peptidase n=1 Tax=Tabrizicola oligotrophica TaxID=2710650 RepID=A0A6M0QTS4_9RHOB|nr:C40 family peptidase [Tabrizicola oligotrophica]NEY90043.1 C40 family peptidase [Tabrizicola oligotrophica]